MSQYSSMLDERPTTRESTYPRCRDFRPTWNLHTLLRVSHFLLTTIDLRGFRSIEPLY